MTEAVSEGGVVLPAFCDDCGFLFPSGVEIGDGASMLVKDVKTGHCPRCGGVGSTPDGFYEIYDEARALAAVLARRPKVFRQATKLAGQAAKGSVSPRDAMREARKINWKLGTLFSKALKVSKEGVVVLGALATIYGVFLQQQDRAEESTRNARTEQPQQYHPAANNADVKDHATRPRPRQVPEQEQAASDRETDQTPDNDPRGQPEERPRPRN